MIREAALPSLATAAALATAVAVVVNPIMPSLPDIQIPAMTPSQVHVPHEVKEAVVAAIPAVRAAVENLDRTTAGVEQTVQDVASAVLPGPGVSVFLRAAHSLAAVAAPASTTPPMARFTPAPASAIVGSSDSAGIRRTTNASTAVRPVRPTPVFSNHAATPPPMAAVSPSGLADSASAPSAAPSTPVQASVSHHRR